MRFDLPAIVDTRPLAEAGAVCAIRRIDDGKPLLNKNKEPLTITVNGTDSDAYQAAVREENRELAAREEAGTPDVGNERYTAGVLARITKAWAGFIDENGEPILCTRENAAQLYAQFPVIRDQVDAFVSRRINFTKASSES